MIALSQLTLSQLPLPAPRLPSPSSPSPGSDDRDDSSSHSAGDRCCSVAPAAANRGREPSSRSAGKKPRGKLQGSKNKLKPPVVIMGESEIAMRSMVLQIAAGYDVLETVPPSPTSAPLSLVPPPRPPSPHWSSSSTPTSAPSPPPASTSSTLTVNYTPFAAEPLCPATSTPLPSPSSSTTAVAATSIDVASTAFAAMGRPERASPDRSGLGPRSGPGWPFQNFGLVQTGPNLVRAARAEPNLVQAGPGQPEKWAGQTGFRAGPGLAHLNNTTRYGGREAMLGPRSRIPDLADARLDQPLQQSSLNIAKW